MTTALLGLGTAALGGLSNQSRAASPAQRHQDFSTSGVALAKDHKSAREARKNAREERLLSLVTDPQIMGLATVFGGLWAANQIEFSSNPAQNAALQGVAAASAVLMGLGRAGVGDLTTLAVATAAGIGSGIGGVGAGQELVPGSGVPWYLTGSPIGAALAVKNKIWE